MNWLHLRDMGEKAEHIREFGTCFFEKYAQIVLATVLGPSFEELVNRDRPDLQSPVGRAVGIEVTRAMEESKAAGLALMQDIAGITRELPADERDTIHVKFTMPDGLDTVKFAVQPLVDGKPTEEKLEIWAWKKQN